MACVSTFSDILSNPSSTPRVSLTARAGQDMPSERGGGRHDDTLDQTLHFAYNRRTAPHSSPTSNKRSARPSSSTTRLPHHRYSHLAMKRTHVTWDTHTSRLRLARPDLGLRFETDISARRSIGASVRILLPRWDEN